MIDLPVDESFAFDFLSVLEVKLAHANATEAARIQKSCNFYANHLAEIMGDEKFREIFSSVEYWKLNLTNSGLFETTENAENYNISARTLTKLSKEKEKVKTKIQEKFFNATANETKIGYEKA